MVRKRKTFDEKFNPTSISINTKDMMIIDKRLSNGEADNVSDLFRKLLRKK